MPAVHPIGNFPWFHFCDSWLFNNKLRSYVSYYELLFININIFAQFAFRLCLWIYVYSLSFPFRRCSYCTLELLVCHTNTTFFSFVLFFYSRLISPKFYLRYFCVSLLLRNYFCHSNTYNACLLSFVIFNVCFTFFFL